MKKLFVLALTLLLGTFAFLLALARESPVRPQVVSAAEEMVPGSRPDSPSNAIPVGERNPEEGLQLTSESRRARLSASQNARTAPHAPRSVEVPLADQLCIDDGVMVNAHAHWNGGDAWAVSYTPPMYPAVVESMQVYILSEGDPYWPWPDAVHQPFAMCVWDENTGQPGTEVFRDTVQADGTPPSWVMAYPNVIISSGDFWVGTEQFANNPNCEGMGVDASYGNGPQNWFRIAGVWTQDPGLTGDLMICAFVSLAAARDVHPETIDSPGALVMPGVPVTPMATVWNTGDSTETFYTLFLVDSAGVNVYTDSVEVTTLMPDSLVQISFPDWTPDGQGNVYDLTCITNSSTDEMRGNDTLTATTMAFLVDSIIECGWAHFPPSIDGIISISEWADADVVDISDILAEGSAGVIPGSVILYAMNNATHLFFAVDYIEDVSEDVNDRVTVFLDENNDDAWEPDSSEGNYWAFRSSGGPRLMYRPLPAGPFTEPVPGAEIGMASLINVTYEFSIPLGTAKYALDVALGDTMGMHVYAHDQGVGEAQGWWLQTMDAANQSTPSFYGHIVLHLLDAVEEREAGRASGVLGLIGANPSPFSATTRVSFATAARGDVSLEVCDASGRVVRNLVNGTQEPGMHSVTWDGRDEAGRELPSGVYFYNLSCGAKVSSLKTVLIR